MGTATAGAIVEAEFLDLGAGVGVGCEVAVSEAIWGVDVMTTVVPLWAALLGWLMMVVKIATSGLLNEVEGVLLEGVLLLEAAVAD